MRLSRIRHGSDIIPVLIDDTGTARDLRSQIPDITSNILNSGAVQQLARLDPKTLPEAPNGPPAPVLADIRRIFCIGLNYSDHAKEAGMPIPSEPILFMKVCPPTGAQDPIQLPRGSQKTDWEAELGVVIGSRAKHVSESNALDHVAGYCVVNDVSERSFQFDRGGQWVKGKSCDSFAPVGPWLVTADAIPDPQNLDLWLEVNGERRQTGNTRTMIFSVAQIIAYLSDFITLEPGDLISTGTPPGVGMGMNPQQFLHAGDNVKVGVEGLGEQNQTVIAFDK